MAVTSAAERPGVGEDGGGFEMSPPSRIFLFPGRAGARACACALSSCQAVGAGQDRLLRLKEGLQLPKNYKSHEHALGK